MGTYCLIPHTWSFDKGKNVETMKRSIVAGDREWKQRWKKGAQRIFRAVKILCVWYRNYSPLYIYVKPKNV